MQYIFHGFLTRIFDLDTLPLELSITKICCQYNFLIQDMSSFAKISEVHALELEAKSGSLTQGVPDNQSDCSN